MSPWEIWDLCTGNYPRYIKIEFPTITFLIKSIKFLNGAITREMGNCHVFLTVHVHFHIVYITAVTVSLRLLLLLLLLSSSAGGRLLLSSSAGGRLLLSSSAGGRLRLLLSSSAGGRLRGGGPLVRR